MNTHDDKDVDATLRPRFWQRFLPSGRSVLGRRLLGGVLLVSAIGALLATLVQLALDYRHEVARVEQDLVMLQESTSGVLAQALWIVNPQTVRTQIGDMLRLPNLRYVEVTESDGTVYRAGRPVQPLRDRVERVFKLDYQHPHGGPAELVGTVRLEASTADIKSRLFERFLIILATQGTKTFIVALFILVFFQWLVTRHLLRLAEQTRRINYLTLRDPITLDRDPGNDELNELLDSLNRMRHSLLRDIELWEASGREMAAEQGQSQRTLGSLPEAVLRLDARGVVSWVNPAAERLCGRPSYRAVSENLGAVMPAAAGFAAWSAERLFLEAQGSSVPVRRRVVFVHDDGRIIGCAASAALVGEADEPGRGVVMVLVAPEVL